MWVKVLTLTFLAISVWAQQQDPGKKETENVGRKHDAQAPTVEKATPVQRKQEEAPKTPPRKVYSPVERRELKLSVERAKPVRREEKVQEKVQSQPVKESAENPAQKERELPPVKGVCVLQEDVRVRNVRHFATLPCLVIYPENKVVLGRAVFEPDPKNFILKGKLIELDGKREDVSLLRSGSENLPTEVKKFILANALVGASVKTAQDVSKIVSDASRSEVQVQIGGSGVQANVGFAEVIKRLPTVAGILATSNLFSALATAVAPQGQIPPEFILPSGTELFFQRP